MKSNKHNDLVESVVLALYLLGVGLIPKFAASQGISHFVFGKVQWLTSQRTPQAVSATNISHLARCYPDVCCYYTYICTFEITF